MDRHLVIDRIIAELRRQEKPGRFSVAKGKDPDTYNVLGLLDVDRLAKAVVDEP